MTRLKKEMKKRNILFVADDSEIMRGAEYDCENALVFIDRDYIVTVFSCAVLPSELRIYDRNFELIGGQDLYQDMSFGGGKTWNSYGFVPFDVDTEGIII